MPGHDCWMKLNRSSHPLHQRELVPGSAERSDADIVKAVRHALMWDELVRHEQIRATVTNGWVTLEGTAGSLAEKAEASRAIARLAGVAGVSNDIDVSPEHADPVAVQRQVAHALHRLLDSNLDRINIDVVDGVVRLTGRVGSLAERHAILAAASCAPGITAIEEHLLIDIEQPPAGN